MPLIAGVGFGGSGKSLLTPAAAALVRESFADSPEAGAGESSRPASKPRVQSRVMHEVFEHTADLGLHIAAPSLDLLLAEAGQGLFEIIAGDVAQIRPRIDHTFEVAGTDPVWLLLDWTTELLAAFTVEKMLFREFTVTVRPTGLSGTARGEPYDPAVHTLVHEVKAITQHELDVHRTATGWDARLIVDI